MNDTALARTRETGYVTACTTVEAIASPLR
jgi:hypothetical protein